MNRVVKKIYLEGEYFIYRMLFFSRMEMLERWWPYIMHAAEGWESIHDHLMFLIFCIYMHIYTHVYGHISYADIHLYLYTSR